MFLPLLTLSHGEQFIKYFFLFICRFEDSSTCYTSVIFDTCDAAYDTKIQVWSDAGCSGEAPSCVAGNDDSCGLQSSVEIQTDLARRYYVWVSGFGADFGSFTLDVTCN